MTKVSALLAGLTDTSSGGSSDIWQWEDMMEGHVFKSLDVVYFLSLSSVD